MAIPAHEAKFQASVFFIIIVAVFFLSITYQTFAQTDLIPPNVTNLSAFPSTVMKFGLVNISINVTDDNSVDIVFIEIEQPGLIRINYTTRSAGSTYYNDTINATQTGFHTYRIYANDSSGNINNTESGNFTSYMNVTWIPTVCDDSDGDCVVSNIQTSNDVRESANLKVSPFGYIRATGWSGSLPGNSEIGTAIAYFEWSTDTGRGAANINLSYFDGTEWIKCAGPFAESGTDSVRSCNITGLTVSQMNSIQVRFTGEDINGGSPATGFVDNAFLMINYTETGILNSTIILPDPQATTNIVENTTFNVTANVTCMVANCGIVNGTPRYNFTSLLPDVYLNNTINATPFFNFTGSVNKTCGLMAQNSTCQLSWIVGVRANAGNKYKMDVNFTSDRAGYNDTQDAALSILPCTVDFTLHWSSISFGSLVPNTGENEAPGNDGNEYNISANEGSCHLDIYISGMNLTNTTLGSSIGVGNMTWSNASNSYLTSLNLTSSYTSVIKDLSPEVNVTTWYWLNAPPVYTGLYTGNITISGVNNGESI